MNDGRIYFLDQANRQLLPMNNTDYITEDELQTFLADYPDLIPGDQIDPEDPRRWLLVKREMGVPDGENTVSDRWSLDHLFLDQDGIPTFVEVKRAVDTRARREVIAQMLDYAANGLVYWTVDKLRQSASETSLARGVELDAALAALVGALDEESIEEYWQQVADNLRTGRVRLIFAVDKAPPELRRLAEFLNEKLAGVDVLIVELKQYRGENGVAIAPIVIGATEASRAQKPTSKRRTPLTREEFLALTPPETRRISEELLDLVAGLGYRIKWNPQSWVGRLYNPHFGRWDSVIFGWAYYWHVGITTIDLVHLDLAVGTQIMSELRTSGLFPKETSTGFSTTESIAEPIREPLMDLLGKVLRQTQEVYEMRGNLRLS